MIFKSNLIRYFSIFLALFGSFMITACANAPADSGRKDVHSYARQDEVVVTHLDWDAEVDFEQKRITAKASLHINNQTGANKLYLDSRDLTIQRATLNDAESETTYQLAEPKEFLGQQLAIDILPQTKVVHIYYHTDPDAAALQWLSPSQTAGKKHPFLFTQSQAILARTWIPCQDSPGIRITYSARVKVDPALMAVMSAENTIAKNDSGIYRFEMRQPIPSYLLALAVGDIEYRSLGANSGVFAEPGVIARAAFEFADTESMMAASEKLYGPYRWEKYDIIVLPPSFPYGGMENPRLTFATPTILAGDRSLVSLIAHELAHSWSGNLVTNATWGDFWLNEGFTTYFEMRIMEAIAGKSYAEMLSQLSYQDCIADLERYGWHSSDTHLYIDLEGRDPDDVPSGVAYDKGRLFLTMLEMEFGREKWDAFLKTYFNTFAFKSMTTADFLDYLRKNLLQNDAALEEKLKIKDWVYGPGLPDNCPVPKSNEFQRVESQLNAWKSGKSASELTIDNWTTHHWLHFLRNLPEAMTAEQMANLDAAFRFTNSGNSEILCAWFEHAIKNNYTTADPALAEFLTSMGRRKFLRPLYEAMAETSPGKEKARKIYEEARSGYHPVSYATIDKILDYEAD